MARTMIASGKARNDEALIKEGEKLLAEAETALKAGENSLDRPKPQSTPMVQETTKFNLSPEEARAWSCYFAPNGVTWEALYMAQDDEDQEEILDSDQTPAPKTKSPKKD